MFRRHDASNPFRAQGQSTGELHVLPALQDALPLAAHEQDGRESKGEVGRENCVASALRLVWGIEKSRGPHHQGSRLVHPGKSELGEL